MQADYLVRSQLLAIDTLGQGERLYLREVLVKHDHGLHAPLHGGVRPQLLYLLHLDQMLLLTRLFLRVYR